MDSRKEEFNNAVLAGLQFIEGFEEIPMSDRLAFAVDYARNYLTWKSAQAATWQSNGVSAAEQLPEQLQQQMQQARVTYALPKRNTIKAMGTELSLEGIIEELEKFNTKHFENNDNRKDVLRKNNDSELPEGPTQL